MMSSTQYAAAKARPVRTVISRGDKGVTASGDTVYKIHESAQFKIGGAVGAMLAEFNAILTTSNPAKVRFVLKRNNYTICEVELVTDTAATIPASVPFIDTFEAEADADYSVEVHAGKAGSNSASIKVKQVSVKLSKLYEDELIEGDL